MSLRPYVPNFEKWKSHFLRMAEGKLKPNAKGTYAVDTVQSGGASSEEPLIKMVTPAAQAVDLAKSELEEEMKQDRLFSKVYKNTGKRKLLSNKPSLSKKTKFNKKAQFNNTRPPKQKKKRTKAPNNTYEKVKWRR